MFEKTKRRLSFVKLRRTKSEGDVDDSESSQFNDDQQVDRHSQASSSTQATRVRSILVQNNTEQSNTQQSHTERSPSPSPTTNSENNREELHTSLTNINANDQELMLIEESDKRRKHQERREEYEDQQAKRRSVITFAPSPARQPRSLEPYTVRDQRRFSLPIPNIPFFRRSSKDQGSPIVVGCKVKVLNKKTSLPIPGTVRYVGRPPGADEDWIGIELDSAGKR